AGFAFYGPDSQTARQPTCLGYAENSLEDLVFDAKLAILPSLSNKKWARHRPFFFGFLKPTDN
ncbi:MAG: hypothetical protein ABJB04_00960, partial [Betaproteobacteria bacterium]